MQVQWYPGHMTKARRMMEEDIRLVNAVIELLDARVPRSSRNPDIDQLAAGKARIILLNKADLADPKETKAWKNYFLQQNMAVVELDSRSRTAAKEVIQAVEKACMGFREKQAAKGLRARSIKTMVVGIPNVGKSTLINALAGKTSAKTGNKPGVTKGKQWIHLNGVLDLLDTPGILWPKFESEEIGLHLGLIGSISDDVLSKQEMVYELVQLLFSLSPEKMLEHYPGISHDHPELALEEIAKIRGALRKGGELDLEKGAGLFLDEFRKGSLGRVTLEPMEE